MTTNLKTCIEAAKCRKGYAANTTNRGAYWLACPRIKLRRAGGDGIGQSSADLTYWLNLRHYRSGECAAVIQAESYHQDGSYRAFHSLPSLLDAATTEDVIVILKAGIRDATGEYDTCYSDLCHDILATALGELGLPYEAAAPDEPHAV
jgi:hypothetical protein